MLHEMFNLLITDRQFYLKLIVEHIQISAISIVIAIIFGLLIGVLISEYKKAARPTLLVINSLYTIPAISMLGFLIPFSGIGDTTAIIALTLYALLPMVRNTYTGIENVDKNIIEASTGMGSTKWQNLFRIKLPLALPYILTGIRSMVIMTISLAGIASFIGAGGLGVAIYRGITTNNAAMTINGSLLIAILALFSDFLLGLFEKRLGIRKKYKHKYKIITIIVIIIALAFGGFTAYNHFAKDNTIELATKPMTEQYILGNMIKLVVEQDTDLKVNITQGVGGGTSNIEPAIENGEFDMYPEYTGTGWNMVLKNEGLYSEALFPQLQSEYNDTLDLKWVGKYGFNNTYGIVVRKEIADKYDLKTCSDLRRVSNNLIFGGEYDFFAREDGYKAFCEAYGLTFKSTKDMDIGLKYQAISQNKIDAMNIFTTDGQLADADVTVLKDDLNFYPSYLCYNVIRKDTLEKYPELELALNRLSDTISDSDMAKMNNDVEDEKEKPKAVAIEYLQKNRILNK